MSDYVTLYEDSGISIIGTADGTLEAYRTEDLNTNPELLAAGQSSSLRVIDARTDSNGPPVQIGEADPEALKRYQKLPKSEDPVGITVVRDPDGREHHLQVTYAPHLQLWVVHFGVIYPA